VVNDGIKDAKLVETKFVKDIKGYVSRVQDAQGNETKIIRNEQLYLCVHARAE
jgi:hypothetical protein